MRDLSVICCQRNAATVLPFWPETSAVLNCVRTGHSGQKSTIMLCRTEAP